MFLCELNLGNLEQAKRQSDSIFEKSENFQVHFRAGIAFNQLGETDFAIKHYEKCVKLKPEEKKFLILTLAIVFRDKKNT